MATKTFKIGLSDADKQAMGELYYGILVNMAFDGYNTSTVYNVNDFVVYPTVVIPPAYQQLYKCIAQTTGAWDSSKWQLAKINDVIDSVNGAVASVDGKANADGYYPTMRVGQSDSIATEREIEDGEDACPPIVFGTAGGNAEIESGYQKFEELRGNSVVFNQRQPADIHYVNNGTGVNTADFETTATYNFSGKNPTSIFGSAFGNGAGYNVIQGHKYFTAISIKPATDTIRYSCGVDTNYSTYTSCAPNVWTRIATITTAGSTTTLYGFVMRYYETESITDQVVYVKHWIMVDLTLMFGAGNEPTSVLEFNRLFPKPYYEYNPGELISSKSSALKSIGQNAFDGEWEIGSLPSGTNVYNCRSKNFIEVIPGETYALSNGTDVAKFTTEDNGWYLYEYDADKNLIKNTSKYDGLYTPNTVKTFTLTNQTKYVKFYLYSTHADFSTSGFPSTITFRLYWDTPNVPYKAHEKQTVALPNIELRSVPDYANGGEIHDVAYSSGGGKRRVGFVDVSQLNPFYNPNAKAWQFPSGSLDGIKAPAGWGDLANAICDKYLQIDANHGYNQDVVGYFYINPSGILYINNGSTTTAPTGTIFYELAEETDITDQENPGWTELVKVDNYGTIGYDSEQTIQVPQAYFIRYTVSLTEFLDSTYERCDGDASKIVLQEERTSDKTAQATIDNQLLNAVGGTLRNLLASSENIDFSNTNFVDLSTLSWSNYGSGLSKTFYAVLDSNGLGSAKGISTLFKNQGYGQETGLNDLCFCLRASGGLIFARNTNSEDSTAFKNSLKGVLLAYEKASE